MPTTRLIGKYGRVTIGTTSGGTDVYASADIYNWTAEVTKDLVDFEGLNDKWAVSKPRLARWTVTAEKYIVSQQFLTALYNSHTNMTDVYVKCYRGGDTTAGSVVIEGWAWINRASITNPNEAITERIELVGNGAPTITTS